MDVGDNNSVLEHMPLSFIYDDIRESSGTAGAVMLSARQTATARSSSGHIPELMRWVSGFLEQNHDMTASKVGHNMLIGQVLLMVNYLVRFGFYITWEDIEALLGPLLSLTDGRNDKPYVITEDAQLADASGEHARAIRYYRSSLRFTESRYAKAIVDAKVQ